MKEMNEKLSMWARLTRRWEQPDTDQRGNMPVALDGAAGMSAMEVELRAMQAKADVPPDLGSGSRNR